MIQDLDAIDGSKSRRRRHTEGDGEQNDKMAHGSSKQRLRNLDR
ncbi:MAG: hypothetical protein WDN69_28755 [Aliidongia sp.]